MQRAYLIPAEGGTVPWDKFHVTDIKSNRPSRVAKTPLETGTVSIDNKTIDPIEITVTGYVHEIDYNSYIEFLQKWRDSRDWKFLRLVSGFEIFDDLILINFTTHESSGKFDVGEITLSLMQIMMENGHKKTANPSNSDTQANGFVNGV